MKKGWQTKTLGEMCEVMNGGTPKTGVPEYWDGKHRWITPAEMGKRLSPYVADTERKITDLGLRNSSAQILPPHSLILSSRAPIGHLVINTEPMATNQGCKGLIPGSQLQHKFLYYYLSSIVDLLNSLGTGATFKELSGGKLKEVTLPVPPLTEQQRIVGILDEAFDGIATAKANAEKNLKNARALFESHLQSVFIQRGKGWVDTTIGEVCDFRGGGTPSKAVERYWKGKIPWVSPKDMKFEVVSDSIDHISMEAVEGSATSLIPKGAVLMVVRSGILARIVPLAVTGRELTINQDLKALCPKNIIESRFLYSLLESKMPILLSLVSRGATVHRLQTEQIRSLNCFLPPRAEQHRIIAQIDSMREETQRLASLYQHKLAALDALKKSLLHQAFTGNL